MHQIATNCIRLHGGRKKEKAPETLEVLEFPRLFCWCSSGDSNPGHPA